MSDKTGKQKAADEKAAKAAKKAESSKFLTCLLLKGKTLRDGLQVLLKKESKTKEEEV